MEQKLTRKDELIFIAAAIIYSGRLTGHSTYNPKHESLSDARELFEFLFEP